MRSPFRRRPAEVDAAAREPGERVLAWGRSGDAVVVATDRALVLADGERLPWATIDRASWQPPVLDLALNPGGRVGRRITLDEAGELPATVRALVTDSVLVSEYVELAPGQGVRLVARRPTGDGPTPWTVVFDEGLDSSDPTLRAQAAQALERLRASLGI